MKILILLLVLFAPSIGKSYGFQEPIKWSHESDATEFEIDFSNEETFQEIMLTLTDVGTSIFQNINLKVANPNIDVNTEIVETISENKIIINIKGYLQRAQKYDAISAITKETQLTVTIDREDKEFMKFIYKIKPASSALVPRSTSKEFTPFPFPVFSYSFETTPINKQHRILLIDGTPRNNLNRGFSLKKTSIEETNTQLTDAKALVAGKSLSVFTKNISLRDLEYIKLTVNGSDYTFNAGVSNLFDQALALGLGGDRRDTTKILPSSTGTEQAAEDKIIQNHFSSILSELKSINELTIEDFQTLQRYQSMLLDSIKGKRLDPSSLIMVSQILSFTPKYLNITSFPLTIPNSDEVTISTEVKYKGSQPNSVSSGTFKTTGALSVNVGSALYLTGLKNNKVYTKPRMINNQPEGLWAEIDKDDQLSLGIGINSEVTYRFGSIFRPAINLGFFVPFDEEITPFFALGPGLSIIDRKVSLSFSYGFAFGKINSINERYRNINLNTIPNFSELDLIQKVWSKSWYIGIGVGFNLNSQENN